LQTGGILANRAFTRAMRRKTQWGGFGDAAGGANLPSWTTVASGASVIISQALIRQGSSGIVDEEFTITRMIGTFAARMSVQTADANAIVAIGAIVQKQVAIAAGVASLPSLEDAPDSEWLYYSVQALRNPLTVDVTEDYGLGWVRQSFDVRSQRVVRSGDSIVWLAEAQNGAVVAQVGGRYLVKLT